VRIYPSRRAPYDAAGRKQCSKCKSWLTPGNFGQRRDSWDGRKTICRECANARLRSIYQPRGRGKRGRYKMTPKGSAAIAESTRRRMTGSSNPRWKGGHSASVAWRVAPEYHRWRRAVFERDNYTCQRCGDNQGGNLTAHHVKEAELYPELRHDIANGVTLCEQCHATVHGNPVKGSRHKQTETIYCGCGCGALITRWNNQKSTRPRRFLPGHNVRLQKRQGGKLCQ
jgi:hypothetical protein